MSRVALISDTHGLLRPEVVAAIRGVEAILHMGDVGDMELFHALCKIAPVHAVRGNTDFGKLARKLPLTTAVNVCGRSAYLVHRLEDLDIDPQTAGVDLVLYGHTHKPADETRDGVQYVNPGSIGARRFTLPISFALMDADGTITFRTIEP